PAEIAPKPTRDLPIPYAGPYEDHADGDRFRLCRVRASGTSAEMAPQMPGTRADAAFELLFRTLAAPNRAKDGGTSKRRRYPRERGQPESRARRACQWRTTLPEQCRADAVSKRRNRGSAGRCCPPRFGVHVRGAS